MARKLPDWLESRGDYPDGILIEALAALEHEQWMGWSKSLAQLIQGQYGLEYWKLPTELALKISRWEKLWVPFADLSEEMKEKDREWARKAVSIFFGDYSQILEKSEEEETA